METLKYGPRVELSIRGGVDKCDDTAHTSYVDEPWRMMCCYRHSPDIFPHIAHGCGFSWQPARTTACLGPKVMRVLASLRRVRDISIRTLQPRSGESAGDGSRCPNALSLTHPDIQTPESGGRLLVILSTRGRSKWAWLFGEASTSKGQAQVSDEKNLSSLL